MAAVAPHSETSNTDLVITIPRYEKPTIVSFLQEARTDDGYMYFVSKDEMEAIKIAINDKELKGKLISKRNTKYSFIFKDCKFIEK